MTTNLAVPLALARTLAEGILKQKGFSKAERRDWLFRRRDLCPEKLIEAADLALEKSRNGEGQKDLHQMRQAG